MHRVSEDYCADCHDPVATGTGWTVPVSLTAEIDVWSPDMDCATCHVMVPYLESLEDTNLLAYAHVQQGLDCLDCHELEVVEQVHEEAVPGTRIKGRSVEMEFCFDCHIPNEHTSYEEIISRTQDYIIENEEINPHEPHVGLEETGQYECFYCHQMHKESPLINGCYVCHHQRSFESCSTCH